MTNDRRGNPSAWTAWATGKRGDRFMAQKNTFKKVTILQCHGPAKTNTRGSLRRPEMPCKDVHEETDDSRCLGVDWKG